MATQRFYTLTASCPDRVGIIARVSGFIAGHSGWILQSHYFSENNNGDSHYFMRMEIRADSLPFHLVEFRERFRPVAEELQMHWKITDSAIKKRVVIMVSKEEHCLYDLLARYKSKEFNIEIPCVISNHDIFRDFVEWHGIAFHHVPVTPQNKAVADAEIMRIFEEVRVDVVVLARYMQIISPGMCEKYKGQIINIHHSFLPSFVGAKPYHQAHAHGVKLIGATCHYVTPDLDQGPIIDQDVIRIDHSDSIEDMMIYGKDIEKTVLARSLHRHLEDRVLIHNNKTIVFR